jgi:hypothetical protein
MFCTIGLLITKFCLLYPPVLFSSSFSSLFSYPLVSHPLQLSLPSSRTPSLRSLPVLILCFLDLHMCCYSIHSCHLVFHSSPLRPLHCLLQDIHSVRGIETPYKNVALRIVTFDLSRLNLVLWYWGSDITTLVCLIRAVAWSVAGIAQSV